MSPANWRAFVEMCSEINPDLEGDEEESDEEDAEVADSPSLSSTAPHGGRAGFGGSSVDSQPQSEVTSPRARPCSPPDAPPHLNIADGGCDLRQPLEDLATGNPNHIATV